MILPGDYVAEGEEYLPGFGVYSDGDKLYASASGELELDAKTHTAKVVPSTRTAKLQSEGTVTLGVIANVMSDSVALVDLMPIKEDRKDLVVNGTTSILHVRDVKRGFTKSIKDEFKVGDIVRVKIIEVSPHTVKLTTSELNLGVIKAYCIHCRSELVKSGTSLTCPQCKCNEFRKMANDYGSGKVI
jgi:exosome complex component CSL4